MPRVQGIDLKMAEFVRKLRRSLVSKLIILVGLILLLSLSGWAYFNINYQKKKVMEGIVLSADWLTKTIKHSTHHAMMHNLRDDITLIIQNMAHEKKIESIRIYNKDGQIKFSSQQAELDQTTNIKAEACFVCHRTEPPLSELSLAERTRIFQSPEGIRLLGIISPITSDPGCSSNTCHAHPEGKKVLGALDVVVSLAETDTDLRGFEKWLVVSMISVFLATATILTLFVLRFVRRPIKNMIEETYRIASGDYRNAVEINQHDELGRLSAAINQMSKKIAEKERALNKQRDEYQNLFELVPCLITVQDRNFKLLRFNRDFYQKFNPRPGDFCYAAYKGRTRKCEICPVQMTFEDGLSHISEESGFGKDGTPTHWIVTTSPVKNEHGEIIAAMEVSLDITDRKALEEELKKSEKKYHAIFDNIPNSVFVLDRTTLEILDCNASVKSVYGFDKHEIIKKSFLDLFREEERDYYASMMNTSNQITQAKHVNKTGETLYVNIRISPSDYPRGGVLLVTTSDITARLETEQQLIQASKMATLGEMATGVAHELNQPLSVIKTASRFFMKKIKKKEKIEDEILYGMAQEIDSYVDRAAKIITHMRDFGRKSDITLGDVQINAIMKRAFEILGQQLKVRGIEVEWDLEQDLPLVLADPDRLEQVFINLLINARDAIDEKWRSQENPIGAKKIMLKTRSTDKTISVEISDTGPGIPDSIQDRIFEPFFTTKKVGQGTGLGLSISYGIIHECNGSIRVVSRKNKGASFIITFPVADEK